MRWLEVLEFMMRVADGPYELKIGPSILTRRGGTDANALEGPRKAILRDWHVGIWVSIFRNLGNCHRKDSIKYKILVRNRSVSREWAENWCTRSRN